MKYIAIDTGTDTGVAVWCTRTRTLSDLSVMKIHRAMDFVYDMVGEHFNEGIKIVVEDARKRKCFKGQSSDEMAAKQQGAGSVKRDAAIWEDFLKDLGVEYEMREPRNTKFTYARFVQYTRYDQPIPYHGKPSKSEKNISHATDAALMIFNRQQ